MSFPTRLLLILWPILMPALAFAECVTLDIRTAARYSAVVFSGTVTKIERSRASEWGSEIVTFEVDRVWKGAVTRQFVIYNFKGTLEATVISTGTKYVVFASRQTPEQRADFGFPASGPPTFGVSGCVAARPYERAKADVPKLGAGRAPSRK